MDPAVQGIGEFLKAMQVVHDELHAFYLDLHKRPEVNAIKLYPVEAKIANYSGISVTLPNGLGVDFWFELVWYGEFWQLDYYISKSNRDEDGCHMICEPIERKIESVNDLRETMLGAVREFRRAAEDDRLFD